MLQGRRAVSRGCAAAALLLPVALPASAPAAWNQPVGGASPINQASDRSAFETRLADVGGVPYVAWQEPDGTNDEIRVARLNAAGTAWEQVVGGASPINQAANLDGEEPSLAAIGGVPHVAWRESDISSFEIRVARLNAAGTDWEEPWTGVSATSGGINNESNRAAVNPDLASIGGVPHIAWSENDGTNPEIRVARLNPAGNAWEQVVGGASPINQSSTQQATEPSLASFGGVPHVAWTEFDGGGNEIRVARLNAAGNDWAEGPPWTGVSTSYGGINNSTTASAVEPSLAAIGGALYIAWREFDGVNTEIRVSRLNAAGTAWEQVVGGASPINQMSDRNALSPSLTGIGGVPYIAWAETDDLNYEIRVARLNPAGNAWEQVVGGASPINQANNRAGGEPSLIEVGGVPHVAWAESDGTNDEARVSRLEPEFTGQSATPAQGGATLTASLHTYGVAYPVGFQVGPALESDTPTETTAAGTENATITRQVDGLIPSTDYQYRPFAVAGAPAPRVLGSTGAFTTPPAPPPGTDNADTAGPDLELSGKRKQELSKKVTLTAECTDEPCELDAAGKLVLPSGRSRNMHRAVKLRPANAELDAGEPRKLNLKLRKRSFKVANRAIEGKRKGKARLIATAADAAGNETKAKRRVTLVD